MLIVFEINNTVNNLNESLVFFINSLMLLAFYVLEVCIIYYCLIKASKYQRLQRDHVYKWKKWVFTKIKIKKKKCCNLQ